MLQQDIEQMEKLKNISKEIEITKKGLNRNDRTEKSNL